ncbi:hypothetical protein E2C01_036563 [Portunus trituberculatus]|uniref:Uncharacterized protein n=1 Tax=Portunus trituberculatus TaxID=210409 RepID=A0A5B7FCE4_PORTR|nr:hypothetical protein [Portunus trituberculatus]
MEVEIRGRSTSEYGPWRGRQLEKHSHTSPSVVRRYQPQSHPEKPTHSCIPGRTLSSTHGGKINEFRLDATQMRVSAEEISTARETLVLSEQCASDRISSTDW